MKPIILCFAGDVMLGRGVDQILAHPSLPKLYESHVHDARDYVRLAEEVAGPIPRPVDFDYVWGDAKGELVRADARIVNLETTVTRTDVPWPGKGIHYRMHPDNVGCLGAARIDVCALANNHMLDWGIDGLVETVDVLHAAGLKTAGAGRTASEAEAPAIVETGGARVVVVAAGHRSSGVSRSQRAMRTWPGVAVLEDLDDAEADALAARAVRDRRPGDVIVASIHWGPNWGYDVPEEHVRFAHALVERGVDVVHGHSSHHPRPIEIYRDRLILYGCGDLLNDYEGIRGHEDFRDGLVLLYFATFDAGSIGLRMVPMRIRKVRLERALREDAAWLAATLARVSAPMGTEIALTPDGDLVGA